MKLTGIAGVYFSPTKTTKKSVDAMGQQLALRLGVPYTVYDLTMPDARTKQYRIAPGELAIVGMPVYGGRIPFELEDVLSTQFAAQQPGTALAVSAVVYGNREYEDAMLQLQRILEQGGLTVVAGCAFLGEHSMTARVAGGRPDEADLAAARAYGDRLADKLLAGNTDTPTLPGNEPARAWSPGPTVYPDTSDACIGCGLCASLCPMGLINAEAPAAFAEGCIRCCACVKGCPVGARSFSQPYIKAVIEKLETFCQTRKEPELYL